MGPVPCDVRPAPLSLLHRKISADPFVCLAVYLSLLEARFADKCCHIQWLSAGGGIGSSPCLGSPVCSGGSIRMTGWISAGEALIGPKFDAVASRSGTSPELYQL